MRAYISFYIAVILHQEGESDFDWYFENICQISISQFREECASVLKLLKFPEQHILRKKYKNASAKFSSNNIEKLKNIFTNY